MKKRKIDCIVFNFSGASANEFVCEYYEAMGVKCSVTVNGTKGYVHNFIVKSEMCYGVVETSDLSGVWYYIPSLGVLVKDIANDNLPF